jgi:hypothetical protein
MATPKKKPAAKLKAVAPSKKPKAAAFRQDIGTAARSVGGRQNRKVGPARFEL